MGFSRQEYWCGLPCSTPGDLPNPGIETPSPVSPDNLGITKSFGRLRHGGSPPPQIFTYILHKFLLVPDPLNLFYSPCKCSLCVRDPLFFLLCHAACGILIPQPGIELMPPTVRAWNSNRWTTREFPMILHSHCVFGERERLGEKEGGREGKRGHRLVGVMIYIQILLESDR